MNSIIPERWHKNNSLKLKMSMPVTLLVAFLLILTTWMMFGFFRDELRAAITREQAALVQTLAGQIDDRLYNVTQHLQELAGRVEVEVLDDPARASTFLDKEWSSQLLFGKGLAFFDSTGAMVATGSSSPLVLQSLCGWDRQLQLTLRSGKARAAACLSKSVDTPTQTSEPVILFAVPVVKSTGRVVGVLAGAVNLLDSNMLGYLQKFGSGEDGDFLSLCSPEYSLIFGAGHKHDEFTSLSDQGKKLRQRASAGETITTIVTRTGGLDTLSSIHKLHRVGLVLGVHQSLEQAYAPLVTLKRELFLVLSGKIALAAVAVWLLMRHLMKPLKQLTRKVVAAADVRRNDEGFQSGKSRRRAAGDELVVLQECFDQMLHRVERQRHSLQIQLGKLQNLIDAIPNPIFFADAGGNYIGFNKAFDAKVGRPLHLKPGDAMERALPPSIAKIVKTCGAKFELTHRSEQSLVFADGKEYPVIFSAASYSRVAHSSPGVVGTLIDISILRKTEDQLRKLNRAVEQSPNSIIVTDIEGAIEYINPTFTRLTGYSAAEAIGENPRILSAGSAPKEYFRTMWTTILNGHEWRGEFRNRKKNGETFWEYALISPLKDALGKVTHFVAVKEDITERKLADRRETLTAQVLSLLSLSNVHSEKIQDILQLIRDFTGCEYVGLRLKEEGTYSYYRSSGVDLGLLSGDEVVVPAACGLAPVIERLSADSFCSKILEGDVDFAQEYFTPGGSFWSAPEFDGSRDMYPKLCSQQGCHCAKAQSVAIIPLRLDDQVIGILQVISRKKNVATRGMVEFLESIANTIAVAFGHHQVAEQLHQEKSRLDFLTLYDPLTELPNRTLLGQKLGVMLERARRKGVEGALLLFDIDRFKTINDSLGHAQGDRLLRTVAQRLQKGLKGEDVLARIGGDEFVVALAQVDDMQHAEQRVKKMLDGLTPVINISDFELYITASAGISMFPGDGMSLEGLLQTAEVAMYRAKQGGRNRHQFYRTDMNKRNLELLQLESQLRLALERDQFVIYYQPKVDLKTGLITGAEALLRWKHPELGIVSPVDFIPMAEETGLIVPIGEWVLRNACARAVSWHERFCTPVRLAVNLSARQFMEPNLLEQLDIVLSDSGIKREYLELEITESVAMHNVEESIATMSAMRARGIRLSIDDFGTGYSSLSYLKRFPINSLKIDRSFVTNIESDPDNAAIASSIIALAQAMDLSVVAEGIEETAQLTLLQQLGCDEAQGFLLARPMPVDEFEAFVSTWKGLPS
ncbi:MAG: EAL domain-containing protein [Desulfuromonadaceae bacterium]|nr:EAL domain-containing protein [Desulfuromonadaceae bacterium]